MKGELQVIVRIDESRHDKKAAQINLTASGVSCGS
jgi:hypothetical protein